MQIGCFGLIIAGGMTLVGGQGIYENWNSGTLQSRNLDQFIKERPSVGWYQINDAQWRLIDAGVINGGLTKDATGDLFIPVRKKGTEDSDAKIDVLLHRTNKDEAAQLAAIVAMPEDKQIEALGKDPAYLVAHPVKGMIEFGMNSDSKSNDAVRSSFGDQLSPDYVVITDGAEPGSMITSVLVMLGGLLLLAITVFLMGRQGAGETVDD
jgi:hypothetical protein